MKNANPLTSMSSCMKGRGGHTTFAGFFDKREKRDDHISTLSLGWLGYLESLRVPACMRAWLRGTPF